MESSRSSKEWSKEMTQEQRKIGCAPRYSRREKPMRCSGVGTGAQSTDWDVKHRIALGNGRLDSYEAPELPDSRTPALLGNNSMAAKQAIIDTFTPQMFLVGPSGYEIRLSPGSERYAVERSAMGHLMLPCSRWNEGYQQTTESQSFVVGSHFAAKSSS